MSLGCLSIWPARYRLCRITCGQSMSSTDCPYEATHARLQRNLREHLRRLRRRRKIKRDARKSPSVSWARKLVGSMTMMSASNLHVVMLFACWIVTFMLSGPRIMLCAHAADKLRVSGSANPQHAVRWQPDTIRARRTGRTRPCGVLRLLDQSPVTR